MQNVGKRLQHKVKKRILSQDTLHESIDSGCGARGAGEKMTSLEGQMVRRSRDTKKQPAPLAPAESRANLSRNRGFLLNFHEKLPNIKALNIIFSKFCYCFTLPGNSASRGSWPYCPGTQQAPGSSHFLKAVSVPFYPWISATCQIQLFISQSIILAKAMIFSPKFLKYTTSNQIILIK